MPRVVWSQPARDDLARIDTYLDDLDGAAAVRIVTAIRATAERLRDFPEIGRPLDAPFRVLSVRSTPYLLFYRLYQQRVEVIALRHGSQDWASEFPAP